MPAWRWRQQNQPGNANGGSMLDKLEPPLVRRFVFRFKRRMLTPPRFGDGPPPATSVRRRVSVWRLSGTLLSWLLHRSGCPLLLGWWLADSMAAGGTVFLPTVGGGGVDAWAAAVLNSSGTTCLVWTRGLCVTAAAAQHRRRRPGVQPPLRQGLQISGKFTLIYSTWRKDSRADSALV